MKVKLLVEGAQLPLKAHSTDTGYDLFAIRRQTIHGGEHGAVPTGIAIELPAGYGAQIKERSSQAKRGVYVLGGVTDNGYRGEIIVILRNGNHNQPFIISPGDRIAQLIIHQVVSPKVVEVEELGESERGERGFGSGGR